MPKTTDVYVGRRIRQRRWVIGITQKELADRVDTKFQQIQKYETGAKRVGASSLWKIANTLNVPISYFFEGLGSRDLELEAFLIDRDTMTLMAIYFGIPQTKRSAVLELARALAETDSEC